MINIYISILEENQNELIEIMNFIIDFNSNMGIEKGFIFKIIGNQYVTSFIKGLTSKTIVNRKIKYEPILLGEVLFDIYEIRRIKYENKNFIINKTEFKVTNNYLNLYFLIARLSLDDEKNNLVKEFEKKIKDKKSDIYEFNSYFSNRELGLFEKIDGKKMKELSEFKNLLKAYDFHCENYYDYNEFAVIFKNKLESIVLKEHKKLFKEQKRIMNKLANSNLTDIFYSFVVLEKYRNKKKYSRKENEYIDRFLSEEQYAVNKFNQEFGQNSFHETVKFVINEGLANPNEEEFDNVMNRLIKYYEEKDFTEKSIENLEEYLKNNGILGNKILEDKLKNYEYNLDIKKDNLNTDDPQNIFNTELDVFGLLDNLKSKPIYAILEYLKKEEDSTLNKTLKKIYNDLENILGNSYLLYIISFFHDLKPEFELLQEYYINLLDNGIIDKFYHDEWQLDEMDTLDEEELFEEIELKSSEEKFIISTNDFLEEWNSYYNLFRINILQKKDNMKFVNLLILSMDNDKIEKIDKNILNLKLLIKYIFNEVDEVINILYDLKFLNDHLENLKNKEMKEQYNTIRKFINKWKRNISTFKRELKKLPNLH